MFNITNVGFNYNSLHIENDTELHGICTIYSKEDGNEYYNDCKFVCYDKNVITLDINKEDWPDPSERIISEILLDNLNINYFNKKN